MMTENEGHWSKYRETIAGRIAYMKGSRLSVLWVILIARDYQGSAHETEKIVR